MLVVGENTYITIFEADALIAQRLDRYNELRLFWETFSDTEKEQYLIRAVEQMENVMYPGRKTFPNQPLTFPRYPSYEVPKDIKLAQAYNALGFLNKDIKAASEGSKSVYAQMGVVFGASNGLNSGETSLSKEELYASEKTAEIMKRHRRGGFRMR